MNARRASIKEPVPTEDERTESEIEADEQAAENDKSLEPYETALEGDEKVESEGEATDSETEEDEPWHIGRPCLNCGNKSPRLTVGWGNGCDKCLVPEDD